MNPTNAHTPGPWHTEFDALTHIVCQGTTQGDGIRVAYVAPQPYKAIEAANAQLIASAPTLLAQRNELREALQILLYAEELPKGPDAAVRIMVAHQQARAALANTKD